MLEALTEMYKDADSESMKAFAEAAVVAAQNVIDHGETEISGEGLK